MSKVHVPLAAAMAFALAACHGDSDGGGGGGKVANVYVAGKVWDARLGWYTATLWKDGAPQRLSDVRSEAFSVCASGGNVYAAGWERGDGGENLPVLWVNGDPHRLPNNNPPFGARALSVHVSGGRVYVAGYEGGELDDMANISVPMLWVDGRGSRLPGSGRAISVFASGGDVYAVGDENSLRSSSVLWTNGEPQVLAPADDAPHTFAESVFVSGGEVYVAGYETDFWDYSAVLWKNSAAQRVGGQGAVARSVHVLGDDVYVAGCEWGAPDLSGRQAATVWKNGEAQRLGGASDAMATSVFVSSNGDVYAAGHEYDGAHHRPMLWKNGEAQDLGGETTYLYASVASSVFVAE